MTQPIPQNAYLVANGTGTLYPTVILNRDPTTYDLNGPSGQQFQVTQRWVNSTTDAEWFLLNFFTTAGYYQANWVKIAAGIATTETLTGNTGGAVPPTGNNINVIGDGTTISVAGNPGTSTLTISALGGGVLEKLTGDSGSATPTAGNINVYGNTAPAASGLTFTGAASTPSLGGTLNVAHGGTGDTSFTAYSVITGGTTATAPLQNVVGVGTANQVLTSNGAGMLPTWQSNGISAFAVKAQAFTVSGTYTPSSGMAFCIIECVGGGGGGGGTASMAGNGTTGGGGGAGSYSRKYSTAAAIGASQTVTIGAAGAGGAAGNNNGSNGGTTSVGVICTANGGSGGGGNNGMFSGTSGAGGTAGTGDLAIPGQDGNPGGGTLIISVRIPSGNGGSSFYGPGGSAIISNLGGAGNPGNGFGAGGGGGFAFNGSGAVAGGNGTAGYVIITEFIT